MGKISIVGVDGSGKTTLMAAFGEAYERPDKYGYFLAAENSQTFDVVKQLIARMRHGEWPGATVSRSVRNLDWRLCRREGQANEEICSVSFLDYAGEIYRHAFGEHADEERKPVQAQIDALRRHIDTSDALLVLINLKDVISGDLSTARTREMLWISRNIFDYASRSKRKVRLALAFSQADVYRETLAAAGGLDGAYRRYLGFIESLYPDMRILAVSAVDRTVVRSDGLEVPAPDFGSTGLDGLLEWIVSTVPGRETEIADRRNLATTLWRELENDRQTMSRCSSLSVDEQSGRLCHMKRRLERFLSLPIDERASLASNEAVGEMVDFVAGIEETVSDAVEKARVAREVAAAEAVRRKVRNRRLALAAVLLIGVLAASGWGWREYLVRQERVRIEERQRVLAEQRRQEEERLRLAEAERRDLEHKRQVGYTIETDGGRQMARWKAGVTVPSNENLQTAPVEGDYLAVRAGYEWVRGTMKDAWKPGWAVADGEIVADIEEGKWKSTKPGYEARQGGADGLPTLVWQEGLTHPQNARLKSGSKEGDWVCSAPGWKWTGGAQTEWQVGVCHPDDSGLIADEAEDRWKATRPGYVWDGGSHAVWKPGTIHPNNSAVYADAVEGQWKTDRAGYSVSSDGALFWMSGVRHPVDRRLVSDTAENTWRCTEPGYVCSGGTDVEWHPGLMHPDNQTLVADSMPGRWRSTKAGYVWTGGANAEWRSGLRHPENENLVSSGNEGTWKSTRPGYVWSHGSHERWCEGVRLQGFPHWITTKEENYARPEPGYVKKDSSAEGWCELVWSPGWIDSDRNRKAGSMQDTWINRITCPKCGGSGRVTCNMCNGNGTKKQQEWQKCTHCNGGFYQVNYGFGVVGVQWCLHCNNPNSLFVGDRSVFKKPGYVLNETTVRCSQCSGVGRTSCQARCDNGMIWEDARTSTFDRSLANQSEPRQKRQVWVEGRYVDVVQSDGSTTRVWRPGHYETREE